MKIKQLPEDFVVEELTDVVPAAGPFALYRLEKRGWTTHDAILAIRRRWQLDANRVSYGGLKDRHAHTVQYFTVFRGPQRRLTHQAVSVEYLGQAAEPYTSKDIRANRFRLTLRSFQAEELPRAQNEVAAVARDGGPNYFDDQRFGSVTGGAAEEFVARLMVRGHYEEAVRQALAAPYEHDRAPQKKEKALLRSLWGDWAALKEKLPRGHARSLIDYLVGHPDDFRGALARLRPDLRSLYLSAYQSHLWNRMLARWLGRRFPAEQLLQVRLRLGNVPMPTGLDEGHRAELAGLTLPLPTARLHLEPGDPALELIQSVLAEEGLELEQLKLKGFREMFFSKGDRAAWCFPTGLHHESGPDEANKGRHKLVLAFELPRGSYATLLVKRITTARPSP